MKEESLLLLSDLQKLINQVVLIDYTIIILGRRFFGIFNFSNQEKTAWMQEKGMYRNLLTGEKIELKDIRLSGY